MVVCPECKDDVIANLFSPLQISRPRPRVWSAKRCRGGAPPAPCRRQRPGTAPGPSRDSLVANPVCSTARGFTVPLDDLLLEDTPAPCEPTRRVEMLEAIERHFAPELAQLFPKGAYGCDKESVFADASQALGLPSVVIGSVFAGRCRDQVNPLTFDRQKRFSELMQRMCSSLWFTLEDCGLGPECSRGIALALALNERFTSLCLSCNSVGDTGAAFIAEILPDHPTLVHLDLSANEIGHVGATSIFGALLKNRSVTSVDLSSRGTFRNRFPTNCALALETLLSTNPQIEKLVLQETYLGSEGGIGIARGLARNTTLLRLQLAGNQIGPKGAVALAAALKPETGLEELNLCSNNLGDNGLIALAMRLGAPTLETTHPQLVPMSSTAASTVGHLTSIVEAIRLTDSKDLGVVKLPQKYFEIMSSARRTLLESRVQDLASDRNGLNQIVGGVAAQLAGLIEAAAPRLPRLKVLLLDRNNASWIGASRILDALQVNMCLESVSLDRSDRKGVRIGGTGSIVATLMMNSGLRQVSLNNCDLCSRSLSDLARGLALNRSLQNLSVSGHRFSSQSLEELVTALGSHKSLQHLNLSSCHLEDSIGIMLASVVIAKNDVLETVNLKDNLLRDGMGRALVAALQRPSRMSRIDLELNCIDCRFTDQISVLLVRNSHTRVRSRVQRFRNRIEALRVSEDEVHKLESEAQKAVARFRDTELEQALAEQELKDAYVEEQRRGQDLQQRLDDLRKESQRVEDDLEEAYLQRGLIRSTCQMEANQLQWKVDAAKLKISRLEEQLMEVGILDAAGNPTTLLVASVEDDNGITMKFDKATPVSWWKEKQTIAQADHSATSDSARQAIKAKDKGAKDKASRQNFGKRIKR